MLSIRLLGAPHIAYADHPVAISRRKSRALLYYLAAHPAPLTRDHLLAFFWPDADRQAAQQNLRTTLYGLRKIFGDQLAVNEDTLALDTTATVDTRLFSAQLALPNSELTELQATLDLYQGDFLNGFTLPDLPEFDDWATLQRAHYRRLMVTGLARLGQRYEEQQAYRHALTVLDRALAFEPLQEDLQRDALRLQTLAGDRAGAIRRYERFCQLLIDELGMPPMAETQQLYDSIITDAFPLAQRAPLTPAAPPISVSRPGTQALPFVGRETELQTLATLAASRQLILLEGEAGIGKSRLLEEFVQRQPSGDAAPLVLIGQARELEATLPYQPLIEALRELFTHPDWPTLNQNLNLNALWRTEVARLLPELTPVPEDHTPTPVGVDELRLWEGIGQFLLALARQRLVMLIIDDLHWADSSTLGLLGYLLRKASQNLAAIYFIAASHKVVPPTPLALLSEVLLREGRLVRLTLDRLPPMAIASLAEQISPATVGLAAWLTTRSEGNPFILEELIQYARDAQLLLTDNQTALTDSPAAQGVPETVYALIRTRLARLAEASRQVLNTAAVIGREFEVEVVARSVTLSDAAVLDNLDELQRLGLIQPLAGMRYRFDHYVTVQVAYQEMGEPRRRLCHRRVAEALESLYQHRLAPLAGLLAHHFAEGQITERAAHYAFRAGQRAASLAAWREAIGFYEQALAFAEPLLDQSQRQAVLLALGRACLHAGQYPRAADALRLALSLTSLCERPVDEAVLYAGLMEALLFETRYTELIEVAEQSSANGQPATASDAEFYRGVALAQIGVDLAEAIVHLQKAESLLSQATAPTEIAHQPAASSTTLGNVKLELGNIFARLGNLSTAIAYFQAGIEVTRAMDSDRALRLHILFHNNLAYHLHLQQDPTAAEIAQSGLTLAQEKGILGALPYLYSTLGEIALAHEDLNAAEDYFNEGLALARQFSALERIAGLTANLGLVAQQRGDQTLAVEWLTEALAQAEALNIRFLVTQIRLWLAALLPPPLARLQIATARLVAEQDGYQQLLAKVIELEKNSGVGVKATRRLD